MKQRTPWQFLSEKNLDIKFNFIEKGLLALIPASILIWFVWYELIQYTFLKEYNWIIKIILIIISLILLIKLKINDKNSKVQLKNNTKWINWERDVAYELNLLQSKYDNFYIINDYQHNKIWNIDHIIISEKWIFTVETKNYKNIFENKKQEAIKQAKKEALYLKKELENEFSIKWVTPILTFVWKYIKENENNIEKIVNPKRIWNIINNSNNTIQAKDIKNIFLYLNESQQK